MSAARCAVPCTLPRAGPPDWSRLDSVTCFCGIQLHSGRALWKYLGSTALSRAGDEMTGPALLLAGFAVTGSPAAGAALLAALTIAAAVGGPLFGVLLDRSPRPDRVLALTLCRLCPGRSRRRGRGGPAAGAARGADRAGRRAVQPGGGGWLDLAAAPHRDRPRAEPRLRARRDDLQRGQPGRPGPGRADRRRARRPDRGHRRGGPGRHGRAVGLLAVALPPGAVHRAAGPAPAGRRRGRARTGRWPPGLPRSRPAARCCGPP